MAKTTYTVYPVRIETSMFVKAKRLVKKAKLRSVGTFIRMLIERELKRQEKR